MPSEVGKARRLARILSPSRQGTVIVPIDDALIFGPSMGLEEVESKLEKILADPPDAVLAFPGVFKTVTGQWTNVAGIANLTASTTRSTHTRKVQIGGVHQAVHLGLDAVAVHVNISSKYESEMLHTLGAISQDCETYGMPLVAIMYPRFEREQGDDNYEDLRANDRNRYTQLVAHAARVGVDLGADLIKTQFTGDADSFRRVVDACRPIPVVVAGGAMVTPKRILDLAYDVMQAGGAGVSFGRNIFGREDPTTLITAIKSIVYRGLTPEMAMEQAKLISE